MTKKAEKFKIKNPSAILAAIFFTVLGAGVGIAGGKITATFNPVEKTLEIYTETKSKITLSKDQPAAILKDEEGNIDIEQLPAVEEVSGDKFEEEIDLGKGAYYDFSTPNNFKNATLGKCIDADGKWGSQCVDLFAVFQKEYTNRWLDTCGTGAARGLWKCKEKNAGNDYDLITNVHDLQLGDWVIFDGGAYGHVGMAMGPYNQGYISLLGENQGGKSCSGGGAATNIINMNTKTFLGAFRPKIYEKPTPTPAPTPTPQPTPAPVSTKCQSWTLKKGDTLGKIMKACEGKVTWGSAMDEYAKSWVDNLNGQVVFDGWYKSSNGVGLYAGHQIVRK